jgi:hypothetical protein
MKTIKRIEVTSWNDTKLEILVKFETVYQKNGAFTRPTSDTKYILSQFKGWSVIDDLDVDHYVTSLAS